MLNDKISPIDYYNGVILVNKYDQTKEINMDVKRKVTIENKLHEFSNYLVSHDTNQEMNLLSGKGGEMLFLSYYSRYFNSQDSFNSLGSRFEKIIERINSGNDDSTFAGGVCGIVWLLEHLVKEDFIDYDLNQLYEDTDEYLNEWMINFMKNNTYDYLHGALGIANYFLNRNTPKTNEYLLNFVKLLSINSIVDERSGAVGFKSIIYNNETPFMAYNFCLSHGMASLIYFLQRALICEKFKGNKEINNLIIGIQNFYDQNQNDTSFANSYYPTWIGDSEIQRDARIAWCYGDVGVGITFLNYGKNHKNESIVNHGIKMLTNTLKRNDLKEESIMDAGICHGSSGLSLIYEEAFYLTERKEFLNASDYWTDVAINQQTHFDGVCGYKAYKGNTIGMVNEAGLLEGISGIGLSFISKLDRNLASWKKIFMIS